MNRIGLVFAWGLTLAVVAGCTSDEDVETPGEGGDPEPLTLADAGLTLVQNADSVDTEAGGEMRVTIAHDPDGEAEDLSGKDFWVRTVDSSTGKAGVVGGGMEVNGWTPLDRGGSVEVSVIAKACVDTVGAGLEVLVLDKGEDPPGGAAPADALSESFRWTNTADCGGGSDTEFFAMDLPNDEFPEDGCLLSGDYLNLGDSTWFTVGTARGTLCADLESRSWNQATFDATEFVGSTSACAWTSGTGCTLMVTGGENGFQTFTTTGASYAGAVASLNQLWNLKPVPGGIRIQDIRGLTEASVDAGCNWQFERFTNGFHVAFNEVMFRSFEAGGSNWVDIALNTDNSEGRMLLVTRAGESVTATLDELDLGPIASADAAQLGTITLIVVTSGDDGGVTLYEVDDTSITESASWTCPGGAYDVNSRENLDGSLSFTCASQSGLYRLDRDAGGVPQMVKLDGGWSGCFYAATAVLGDSYWNVACSSESKAIECSKSDAPLTGTVVFEDE